MTGQCKTRTALGRPRLVRNPRLIPESVFYTQSVMLSPRFIPQSVFYTQLVRSLFYTVTRTLRFCILIAYACSFGMRDDVLLLPKLAQLFRLRTRL